MGERHLLVGETVDAVILVTGQSTTSPLFFTDRIIVDIFLLDVENANAGFFPDLEIHIVFS